MHIDGEQPVRDGLADIMVRQLTAQRESFGVDPLALEGAEIGEFVRWNILALEDELHEALDEVQWKPWSSALDDGFIDRDAFLKELIDAQHFLNNLYLVAKASPEEIRTRYLAKSDVNAQRQTENYDAVSTKCEHCGRATDEPE